MNTDLKKVLFIIIAIAIGSFFYLNLFAKMPMNIWLARALGAAAAGLSAYILFKFCLNENKRDS